ncbi:MAG: hypothetical protein WBB28_02065 [Crinalium sp.]
MSAENSSDRAPVDPTIPSSIHLTFADGSTANIHPDQLEDFLIENKGKIKTYRRKRKGVRRV